uniref:Carboxylesterase type B domain-containing protein n=1 Tax=Ditylenchus dipsaci TaxID=166011 RepID=A0A915CXQ4_9BILA
MGGTVSNSFWFRDYQVTTGCVAKTKAGFITGKTYCFESGRQVNAFLGVPYARNGAYQDRFQKPKPLEPWEGELDCTKFGKRAIQDDMVWDKYITPIAQTERHCLSLNVFVPKWTSEEFADRRPVMVFVHGGGFLIHSAANYGDWNICQNLCMHDVIVCVVQYRLGLLGFLSTGDEQCPGNFGLWDQLEAFKWIQNNIREFGGDPENVTAFGQSAGAASVDFLSLSPYSKGLFHRIILMGGNACSDWALAKPQRTLRAAIGVARKLGWTGDDSDSADLLEFLKKQAPNTLRAPLVGKSAFNRDKNGLEFCPVERAPKITVIIGTADYEALLFHALGRAQADMTSIRKFVQLHVPSHIPNHQNWRKRAEHLYIAGVNPSNKEQVARSFLRLYSDILMNNCTQQYCQEMVSAGHDVYLYNMTYFNPDGFGFFTFRMPFLAATHCHDLRYLVGKGLYSKFRPNYDDLCMLYNMTSLWTNFAKFGNPNGLKNDKQNWERISVEDTYKHFQLDLQPSMKPDYQDRRADFWLNEFAAASMEFTEEEETSEESNFSNSTSSSCGGLDNKAVSNHPALM